MLRGIAGNRIIVGAYVDKRGGVCPMLAAHRNGGRTNFGAFARAWDAYTGAKKPRRASAREVRTLRGYLELALLREGVAPPTDAARTTPWAQPSLTQEVNEVKASRRRLAEADAHESREITIEELLAQTQAEVSEQRSEARAAEVLGDEAAEDALQPDRG
jgi:hypothetical protein